MIHTFPTRVYYQDTDAGGIVYHPNYLSFAERGRTEMINDLGLSNSYIRDELDTYIVVRHVDANYTASAKLEDRLNIETEVTDIGRTSFTLTQIVKRDDGLVCATMIVKLVCVNIDSGRPVRIPEILKEKLS
jgi:acyl-CoA thioester hydrolase